MVRAAKIIGIIVALIIVIVLAMNIFASQILHKKLRSYVRENCASCVLDIETIKVNGFLATVTLSNVKFSGGNPKFTAIETQIPVLKIEFNISGFFKSIVHVDQITIENPQIKIVEGDLKSKSKNSKEKKKMEFIVDEVEIKNGQFTYVREHNGKLAPIHVTNIDVEVEEFGSTENMLDELVEAEVTALLEASGKIRLKVLTYLFKSPLDIKVSLNIEQFDLDKMNGYFVTNDGIKLTGQLVHGNSEVVIKGQQLFSNVQAEYDKLNVEFKNNSERTALGAFFSTLVADMQIQSKNTNAKTEKQTQSVELKREPEEPLVGFIFRGIKEAALKVTKQK